MGRLAAEIAAVAVNANNLPPKDQLPDMSLWDALLPKSCSSPKAKNKVQVSIREVSNVSSHRSSGQDSLVTILQPHFIMPFTPPAHHDHEDTNTAIAKPIPNCILPPLSRC